LRGKLYGRKELLSSMVEERGFNTLTLEREKSGQKESFLDAFGEEEIA
jgi:hypothetical protein